MFPRARVEVARTRSKGGDILDLNFKFVDISKSAAQSTDFPLNYWFNFYTSEPHLCKSTSTRFTKSLSQAVRLNQQVTLSSLTIGQSYLIEVGNCAPLLATKLRLRISWLLFPSWCRLSVVPGVRRIFAWTKVPETTGFNVHLATK